MRRMLNQGYLFLRVVRMEKKLNINLQVYVGQVSGKEPKLLSQDRTKLLKGYNSAEAEFYRQIFSYHISHPFSGIHQHIPRYYGELELESEPEIVIADESNGKNTMVWLTHLADRYKHRNQSNKFIVLENLTHGWQLPNIFDIKIGGRNVEGKKHKITKSVSQFFLKLNGCRLNFVQGTQQTVFLSKYYLIAATDISKFYSYFRLFFFNGSRVLVETIKAIRSKLSDLILSFKALRGYRFISSSVCMIYDARHPERTEVNMLDFARVIYMNPGFIDEDSLSGLLNIYNFLTEIISIGQSNVAVLQQLCKHYCEADITIVPDRKYVKYGEKGNESPTKV